MKVEKTILENKTIVLNETGMIEIRDKKMKNFVLKFESVKLSKTDLENIQNYMNKMNISEEPDYYPGVGWFQTLEDYVREFINEDKVDMNYPLEFFRDDEKIFIEIEKPADLESHWENVQRILSFYNRKEGDNFKVSGLWYKFNSGDSDTIYLSTNLTRRVKEEYDREYHIIQELKNAEFKKEKPIERLWEDEEQDVPDVKELSFKLGRDK